MTFTLDRSRPGPLRQFRAHPVLRNSTASKSLGKTVALRVRRGQGYLDVSLTPEPGCNTLTLTVRRR
jgi:hypothetical protein